MMTEVPEKDIEGNASIIKVPPSGDTTPDITLPPKESSDTTSDLITHTENNPEVESVISKHNQEIKEDEENDDQTSIEVETDEVLEPLVDSKRWIIGKPPELGGKETQYGVYYQRPMGFIARGRWFALLGKTLSGAIRTTGGSIGGMDEIFGKGDGTIIERGQRLREHDFKDASSFFALAMELVGENADFLVNSYVLWLDVPYEEKNWIKKVLEQPWDPDHDRWGLSEDAGMEMIELFIYQNYEDIRRFFLEKIPKLAKRVSQIEKNRKKEDSSALLK